MEKGIIKTEAQDLQKSKSNTLCLEKTSKPVDLIKCKNISLQVKEHGELAVLTEVRLYVEKCAMALNIQMSQIQVVTLCEDLIDTYSHDSIEDLRECLKSGRTGAYGFGHNSRNSLNMILIREWMAAHLEKKAIEREKHHQKTKILKQPIEDIDYEAYKIRAKKEDAEKKEAKRGSEDYQKLRAEYLMNRDKPSE